MYIYIYVYMCMYMCMYVYVWLYMISYMSWEAKPSRVLWTNGERVHRMPWSGSILVLILNIVWPFSDHFLTAQRSSATFAPNEADSSQRPSRCNYSTRTIMAWNDRVSTWSPRCWAEQTWKFSVKWATGTNTAHLFRNSWCLRCLRCHEGPKVTKGRSEWRSEWSRHLATTILSRVGGIHLQSMWNPCFLLYIHGI